MVGAGIAGFAKGFGDAFATSFSNTQTLAAAAREKKADRENDLFKENLKAQAEIKEARIKAEAKDKAMVGTAKNLAATYNAPEDYVLERLRESDGDTSSVEGLLKKKEFGTGSVGAELMTTTTPDSVIETRGGMPTSGTVIPDDTVGLDEEFAAPSVSADDMETQMGESGMLGEEEEEEESPTVGETLGITEAPSIGATGDDRPWTDVGGGVRMRDRPAKPRSLSDNNLYVEATRGNPEAIAALKLKDKAETLKAAREANLKGNTVSVFDPEVGEIVQVRPNGEGEYTDLNNRVVKPKFVADDRFFKESDDILNLKKEKPVVDYDQKLSSTVSVAKSLNELGQIIKKDKRVLTATANAAELGKKLNTEVQSVFSLLQSEDLASLPPEDITRLEQELNFITPSIGDLGELKAVFDAKAKITAYRLGRSEGETGGSYSNADVVRWEQSLIPSNDDVAVLKNLKNIGKFKIGELAPIAKNLNRDARVLAFNKRYGEEANPLASVGGQIAPDFETYRNSLEDQELNSAYDFLNEPDEVRPERIVIGTPRPKVRTTPSGRPYEVLD